MESHNCCKLTSEPLVFKSFCGGGFANKKGCPSGKTYQEKMAMYSIPQKGRMRLHYSLCLPRAST
jgi:hypothetical protein